MGRVDAPQARTGGAVSRGLSAAGSCAIFALMNIERARSFRKRLTPGEAFVWSRLKMLRAEGIRVRRQAPMGPYFADFACHSARLIIEIDGGGHTEPAQARHDARRDAWFESQGYQVMRIWNRDLYVDHDGAFDTMVELLRDRHRTFGRQSQDEAK